MSDEPRELEKTGWTALAAALFVVGILSAAAFATIYSLGEEPLRGMFNQALGVSAMVGLLGIGAGLVVWAHELMPGPGVEERPFRPSAAERRAAGAAFREKSQAVGRRSLLGRLLFAALGAIGLAALFPMRSLVGKSPFPERVHTGWRRGERVVTEEGKPVAVDEMEFNSILTVFPENRIREADSQTALLRLPPTLLRPQKGREDWSPEGYIAFSKVCTHAGCPVGLYQVESQRLFCPCHQSAFDVLRAAKPLFGPATRPLPQLPLTVDAHGFLVAQGDFSEPVGPGFWTLP